MIDKLKPNPDNPRIIRDEAFIRLKNKIKEFPKMLELRPIVYDKNYIVLGGNQRLRVLQDLAKEGFEIKDTYFKSASDLTDEEKRRFIILDNIADGEWDWEAIANEWTDLPLDEWGLDPTEWDIGEIKEDEAPPVEEGEPDSKYGEVYELGRHRLMVGDATKIEDVEKLMDGKKADMVFTDPPYAIFGSSTGVNKDIADFKMVLPFFESFISNIKMNISLSSHIYICCDWRSYPFINSLGNKLNIDTKNVIVWDKKHAGLGYFYRQRYELLAVMANGKNNALRKGKLETGSITDENLWEISRDKVKEHYASKPVELCERAIKNSSKQDDTVLDLFGGSGSTLIACEQTNRTCYMMELDPKYCDVIRKRYAKFIGREDE